MPNAPARSNLWVYAAFLAVIVLGGSNFVAVRFSNRELPPFWGASIRFFAAAGVLAAIASFQRIAYPRGRALAGAIAFGLVGIGAFYALAYWGLLRAPAGLGAVTIATTPLLTFGFAVAHRQETFRWRPLLGGIVGLAGIAFMFRGSVSDAVPLLSLLALLAAAASAAEATVILKWFPKTHPVTTNVVGLLTGALALLVLSLAAGEPRPLPAALPTWAAVAYLALLGSCALFVLFLFALKRMPASTAAYQFVLMPPVTVIVSALLERAAFSPTMIAGMVIVLGGVYVGIVSPEPSVQASRRLGTEPCLNCPE